ncbi:MAG: phosphoribosylformylglycinamidine cyclo-ligase [Pseudomonadota bacterium]
MSNAYKSAGVDIDAGDRLVKVIGPLARATARRGADAALGGFGGLFDLKAAGFDDPILVAGADGVGTKLKLAFISGKHDTIGIDLVAMCANDVLAQGAEPLFFLDYFATGQLDEAVAADVVSGVAEGCKQAGCALIGGETAEMPGMYADGEYDLAGFCVGAVERGRALPQRAEPGDVLIGVESSGPHSNGYSLIRKIIAEQSVELDETAPFDSARSLGEALLAPTRIYVKSFLPPIRSGLVRGFAHITGGGLTDNIPRMLPPDAAAKLDDTALALPPLFEWLKSEAKLQMEDMRRTFNCGIGAVALCDAADADTLLGELNSAGETARVIGAVASKEA